MRASGAEEARMETRNEDIVVLPELAGAEWIVLAASFGGCLVIFCVSLVVGNVFTTVASVLVFLTVSLTYAFRRRFRAGRALAATILCVTACVFAACYRFNGVNDVAASIPPFLILLVGLMRNRRILYSFAALVISGIVGVMALRWWVVRTEPFSALGATDVLIFAIVCGLAAVITARLLERFNESYRLLRESEARYHRVYRQIQDAYFEIDLDGTFRELNPAAERLFGVPSQKLIGASLRAFYADPTGHDEWVTTLRESGRVTNAELSLRDSQGAERHVLLTAFWVEGSDRLAITGSMRDITGRKQAEKALAQGRAELQAIYSNAPVMMCVLNSDRRVLYANPAFTRFTGAREEELIGGRPSGVFGCINALDHPSGCGFGKACPDCNVRKAVEDTLRTGTVHTDIEYRATLARAETRRDVTLLGSVAPIHTLGETRVLLCFHDITELKQAEAERQRMRAELMQASKMESIGRLAGGIAHEFNNQLTVINGYSQLIMQRMAPGDPQLQRLSEISRAGDRSADLVRRLLAYSRKQVLQPEVVRLNDIVARMEPMLRRLVREDIDIVVTLDPESPSVLVDRHQVEQAIMNLVANSRDAMPDGGVVVVETTQTHLDGVCANCHEAIRPGTYVQLTVRDTGTGMDKQTLEHLFEPFFTTKEEGAGTGLGLSMVQGIAIQSGGHVDVESEPGKGSSFHILLPITDRPSEMPSPVQMEDAVGGAEAILLVEDEDVVRGFVATTLKQYGYSVVEAVTAEQALELCLKRPFDLLLTDIVMPKMSGLELARHIGLALPGLKTLFISGYSKETHHATSKFPAGENFIQKPFSPEALATKVRGVLQAR